MLFIGNLKNHIPTQDYINTITSYRYQDEVWLALPLVYISKYGNQLKDAGIKVGAQCVDLEQDFANRGEVFAEMLKDVGTDFVFLGHQIDKKYTASDYERKRKKIASIINNDMKAVVAIGETLEERENGTTNDVVGAQIKADLEGLAPELAEKVVIAYEPIWAIGTGKTATDEQANETIMAIRNILAEMFGKEVADKIRIQYGGSVKPGTIKAQMAMSDIDGALVGGASLVATDFAQIVNY